MSKTSGGAVMARMLREEGVETIFGIIDGTYTQLFVNCVELGMTMLTPRHESIAAHMAGAYARLTGKLGVCLASNGPGVANVLSGVAVENAEGNRVLLLTSARRAPLTYPDRGGTYQYFDQVGVIRAMSKWSFAAKTADRLPELMRAAFRACYSGRPGVVHLDVPEDVINGEAPSTPLSKPAHYRRLAALEPSDADTGEAARLLREARLPLIHAGSGVVHALAFEELRALAGRLQAPVTTSWAARGSMVETDGLNWPMVHIKAVNALRNEADLVLCLGSRVGETDWWGKPPYWAPSSAQRWIQVDLDPETLGRTRPVDLAVVADVKAFLRRLIDRLEREPPPPALLESRRAAVGKLARERDKDRAKLDEKLNDRGAPMLTAHVSDVCRRVFEDDAIAVMDGGNTAVWANFFHQVRVPNTLLTTNHMGHLGAGVGQALGAAAAHPGRQVYCVIGDGAMGFHPQEIETAVRHDLRPVFLVACDKQWGMVKINQSFALKPLKTMLRKSLRPDETVNTELREIRFDLLAAAMGAHGERVSDPGELRGAIERSLASGRCAVIHVDVDPVKHMWAPGLLHFKNMHQEPAGR